MPPRIPSRALAQPLLARTYATPVPPAPFTTPVENATGQKIDHKGTTSPSCPSSASSSSSPSDLIGIDVDTPFKPARQYPARKQFLNYYYDHLIKTSPLFLLFECDNLSVKDWKKIRNAIQAIPIPEVPTDASSSSSSASSSSTSDLSLPASSETAPSKKKKKVKATTVEVPPINPIATMTVLRPGVFSAVARHHTSAQQLVPWLTGQRAILHSQHLSPPYLQQVLQATTKAVKACQKEGNAKQPKLNLVVGMIENRLFPAKQVEEVAKLPDLQTLRGQLVGSLEMPGRSLLGILEQARGGSLVRTLQGLEASMKEKEGGETSA